MFSFFNIPLTDLYCVTDRRSITGDSNFLVIVELLHALESGEDDGHPGYQHYKTGSCTLLSTSMCICVHVSMFVLCPCLYVSMSVFNLLVSISCVHLCLFLVSAFVSVYMKIVQVYLHMHRANSLHP